MKHIVQGKSPVFLCSLGDQLCRLLLTVTVVRRLLRRSVRLSIFSGRRRLFFRIHFPAGQIFGGIFRLLLLPGCAAAAYTQQYTGQQDTDDFSLHPLHLIFSLPNGSSGIYPTPYADTFQKRPEA